VSATLRVSEVFGPTLQGEGRHAGDRVMFLRLMGCNLSCSWCDTPYTWDATRFDLRAETTLMTLREIREALDALDPRATAALVISGGEPLLQQDSDAWAALLHDMTDSRGVHIETNGTIAPNAATLRWTRAIAVSPKLPHAGPHRGHQNPVLNPAWADVVADYPGIFLKVVVLDEADVRTVARHADGMDWPLDRVWVMPEGTEARTLGQRWPGIASEAARVGVNASHRLHVLAWGDERGR
jgi:7-carboxy-7-deazaguanine synthase